MNATDDMLVRRTLAGDVGAYGVLVGRYRDAAYGLACHLVGDFEEAKDLTQEALVRAFYRLPDLRDPAKFAPWLRQIVASICADWRRRKLRRHEAERTPGDISAASADPHRTVVARELGRSVEQMIARLSEPQRQAVIMYHIDGLSHREIGEFLGVSADAIKMRLQRAREQLREDAADLVAEAIAEHALRPSFAQEVATMTVHFGVSGHGDSRSAFPDETSRRLYAELYPRGDLARAAALADVARSRAQELARRWEELSVVERTNAEVLCRAPIVTAPDVEELRPWWDAFAEIGIEELERRLPELRQIAEDSAGLAPLDNALEAVVYWQGASEAVAAARVEGLAAASRPKRGDTGEYHLFGTAAGAGPSGGYGNSTSHYGDMDQWCLVVVTWYGVEGQVEMAEYLKPREFPTPDDPLLWRLVRPLRSMDERPRTRQELVEHIRHREITDYRPDELVDALVRFRFISEQEPHRLLIPVVDGREGSPLHGILGEMHAAMAPKLRAIEPMRRDAVGRCSFRDCLSSDVDHLCYLKASAWLKPMVFDRGLVPPLPEAAYADRGVFLWRYPQESP